MSDSGELSDWELLSNSPSSPTPFEEFESESESDTIKHGYFAIDSGDRRLKRAASDEAERVSESMVEDSIGFGEKGGIFLEEEKTSELGLAEPGRMGNCAEEAKLEVGLDAGDWVSDKAAVLEGGAIGETEEFDGNGNGNGIGVFDEEVTDSDMGYQNSAGAEVFEAEKENLDELGLADPVRVEDYPAEEPSLDVGQQRAEFGRVEEIGEAARMEDSGELAVGAGEGDAISACEGAKGVSVWLKMPLELLKMCVLKVRPVWSISIAAGIIGMLMLGRRLYKMKGKKLGIPLKISLDDKKASQLVVRAGRLSEAVRRVPFVRLPPPAGSVSLWPVAGSLRALDW